MEVAVGSVCGNGARGKCIFFLVGQLTSSGPKKYLEDISLLRVSLVV